MIGRPLTIRARLALWFAAAMAVVLLGVGVAARFVVQAGVLGEVSERTRRDLEVAATFVRHESDDVAEIAEFNPEALVLVLEGERVVYSPAVWAALGLPGADQVVPDGVPRLWETPRDTHYRVAGTRVDADEQTFTVIAAVDEEPARRSLDAVTAMLAIVIPVAWAGSAAGGYWLAGRMLAPVRRMAEAAERISGERLGERLPVENPNDEFGRLAVVTNRSLDRVQEAFDRQRRFTADASHEMRTPLTAIRSAGEVALRSDASPDQCRETIGSMLEAATYLTALTDRLLLLARADAGTHPVMREPVDVPLLVREVVEMFAPVAEEKSLTLESQGVERLLAPVDPTLLRYALNNLVSNAIKYTPEGGRVCIDASGSEHTVLIKVSDTGPGIAAEHLPRIFDRFYRIDLSRSPGASGGVGLGLAIVTWAVEAHGGHVEIESEPDRGSVFRIVIPLDHDERPTGSAP